MFSGCPSLQTIDISSWDTSGCKEFRAVFTNCTSLTSIIGLDKLDYSGIRTDRTASYNLLAGCTSYAEPIDLSRLPRDRVYSLNFSGVKSDSIIGLNDLKIGGEFHLFVKDMVNLTSLDISTCDTSKVTHWDISWNSFVYGNTNLRYLNMSNLKVNNPNILTNWEPFRYFGRGCPNLEEIIIGEECDFSKVKAFNWFNGVKFNNLKKVDLSGIDLQQIEAVPSEITALTSQNMFGAYVNTTLTDFTPFKNICIPMDVSNLTGLSVESLVKIMESLVSTSSTMTLKIGSTNLAKLTPAQIKIATDKNWTVV